MPPVTKLTLRALDALGGPRIVLAAIPGGIRAVAHEAGVSTGRVSQVLRMNPLPVEWARRFSQMAGCSEWEVYEQLGQRHPGSDLGPLFDVSGVR
jgi:hypothetical protein